MKIKTLIKFLDTLCPQKMMMEEDNSGFQIGNVDAEIKKILIALDCSFKVVKQAIAKNANLIITHHPLFWPNKEEGIKNDYQKKIATILSKNQITVFALHTNYDELFLKNEIIQKLKPQKVLNHPNTLAIEGRFNPKITIQLLQEKLKKKLLISKIPTWVSNYQQKIEKVLIVPGAGGFIIDYCQNKNIDVLITGEIKWNEWVKCQDYNQNIMLIGHQTEEFFISKIENQIQEFLLKQKTTIAIEKYYVAKINYD